jgi:hypothetical protein
VRLTIVNESVEIGRSKDTGEAVQHLLGAANADKPVVYQDCIRFNERHRLRISRHAMGSVGSTRTD